MEIVAPNEAIMQEGLATLVRQAADAGQADRSVDPDAAATWIRKIIDAVYLNADSADVDPVPMLLLIVKRFLSME